MKKLEASALYMVIIIALVIAIICSSLIIAAYFFRLQYQQKFRYDRLQTNLSSGINMILAAKDSSRMNGLGFSLYDNSEDSVSLKKISWGLFEVGIVKAFTRRDSLYKTFMTGRQLDSVAWAAIYLIDEDRPVSVSGKTGIEGDAYLPKAGIKPTYVDNKAYEGDRQIVKGTIRNSQRELPPLNSAVLQRLEHLLRSADTSRTGSSLPDTLNGSFLHSSYNVYFGKKPTTISHCSFRGNVVLYSDTLLVIDSTAILDNVLVIARAIQVNSGFKGNCQLFATDSVGIQKNCTFSYPSCIGLLKYTSPLIDYPRLIHLGEHTDFQGILFSYEKEKSSIPPLIRIGKGSSIKGQVYSGGALELANDVTIDGSTYASRFLYQSEFTRYENYLINVRLNSAALSPYYLTSELLPAAGKRKKILRWLETN